MSESCPDHFPEDWIDPVKTQKKYGTLILYADGTRVVIDDSTYPPDIETRYTKGWVHFEHGVDEDGEPSNRPTYIENGH